MQEFDVAFHHNIMVKRKKRLVVLMALDRPTDLYDNDASDKVTLRQFLSQYTYIDYTADDWLDKLHYALPLRGMHALQNTYAVEGEVQDRNVPDTDMLVLDPFIEEHHAYMNYDSSG